MSNERIRITVTEEEFNALYAAISMFQEHIEGSDDDYASSVNKEIELATNWLDRCIRIRNK